jgi:acyl-CoA thioesterase-1
MRIVVAAALIVVHTVAATAQRAPGRSEIPQLRPSSSARPRVVALGDSLTAGLGLRQQDAYPAVLQRRIDAAGLNFEVVNAGVSGDTSAGGLRRLDWALGGDVKVMILALGANDGLRALPPAQLKRNLAQMIEKTQARGITVVLAGMESPPNFGRTYSVEFHNVYPELAKQYGVTLVPFLLEGVAGLDSLNQSDGIHPSAEGARIVADNIWAKLKPILEKTAPRGRGAGVPGS